MLERIQNPLICLLPWLLLATLTIGCTHEMQSSFVKEDFAQYEGKGTSAVAGQAFLTTRGGNVKYGAGRAVYLIPVTPYTAEWVQNCLSGTFGKKATLDPRLSQYVKIAQADGEGRFQFSEIPAGNYYLACYITWEIPDQILPEGGWVVKSVNLQEGSNIQIVLTG
jgi:hypothetical protein